MRGGTTFPSPMALGAASDAGLCREVGLATAAEAARPASTPSCPGARSRVRAENPIVCTRAFGDDPETVERLGAAMIRGLQDGGVLATAKPSREHGRTRLDSHDRLPVVA